MKTGCWLPSLEFFHSDKEDWITYQNKIYAIFKKDFITSQPDFNGQKVNIRKHPIEYGKEDAFFHVTCKDYFKNGQRDPDPRRCERIRWIRAFIENYQCNSITCTSCSGIKFWEEPYKNTRRMHILLEEEKYMVVIELRKTYCLLITAFYLDNDHMLRKKLKKYAKYKNNIFY